MSQPLRIGLLGAGNISAFHLPAFQQFPERVQIAAVCDVNEAAARTRAEAAGGVPVFTSLYAMLNEAELDAVDICTPHCQHHEQVLACLAADKHVLLEKPMAVSMDQCREMVDAAEAAGRVFMVAQCQRYMPSYVSVRDILHSGRIGTIRAARWDSNQHIRAFAPDGHWLLDGAIAGGGVAISVNVHRVDLMRFLVGEFKRVCAVGMTSDPAFKNTAENFMAAILEFENGAIGETFGTYSGYRMPWGEMFAIYGDDGTVHAVPPPGSYLGDAQIAWRGNGHEIKEWEDQYKGFEPAPVKQGALPTADGIVNEILHFADCVETGAEPVSSGRDNLGTMRVILGMYESMRTGQPVELAEL